MIETVTRTRAETRWPIPFGFATLATGGVSAWEIRHGNNNNYYYWAEGEP